MQIGFAHDILVVKTFPGEKGRDVFRGPRPDAVLGTPQRSRGRPPGGVDVSADDERGGDGWWEFRDGEQ